MLWLEKRIYALNKFIQQIFIEHLLMLSAGEQDSYFFFFFGIMEFIFYLHFHLIVYI